MRNGGKGGKDEAIEGSEVSRKEGKGEGVGRKVKGRVGK